jgi:nucleoside-diphosphate-sugar epimerase
MTVPSILEDITDDTDAGGSGSGNDSNIDASALDVLTSLDFVAVGGGALKPAVGEKLSRSGVPILNHYGTTELGALAPIHKPDAQYDWRYLRLRTDIGLKLIHVSADTSEPSVPSDPPNPSGLSYSSSPEEQGSNQYHGRKSSVSRCKLIGYPFGWNSAFELQDDLECNPLHPDSEVRILGRQDDLIVLATGEKVLPLALEESISQCPLVKRALAFGDGRFELGIIIEPSAAGRALDGKDIIDTVWPLILTANESADSFARVSSKTAIIITSANKVIPVSDKGSPMRKEAYHVFASEIEAIYKNLDDGSVSETSMEIELPSLEKNLQEMAQYCLQGKAAPGTWNINDDFFELGMDSLQATRLLRILVASIVNQKGLERISADYSRDFVYCHPSISKMAAALRGSSRAQSRGTSDRATLMEKLLQQYEAKPTLVPVPTKSDMKIVVLLTGSTGSLGAHVLERMSKDPKVHQVICLVRRPVGVGSRGASNSSIIQDPSLRAAQELANKSRKIFLPDEAWAKIEFLNWEAGAEQLGLKSEQYSRLSLLVTHIFHCAWPMDFKRELPSFERQIHAVKCVIDLAVAIHNARPHLAPRIVFASSIAVTGQYPLITKSYLVPEVAMDNPSVTLPIGYAESKWICEKLMEKAAHIHQHKIQPVVVRIGQLSGSERTGHWNSCEHIPALIKASQEIGCFPDLHGVSA